MRSRTCSTTSGVACLGTLDAAGSPGIMKNSTNVTMETANSRNTTQMSRRMMYLSTGASWVAAGAASRPRQPRDG